MTVLRQKMIEDMQLRGFAERTQEAYLLAVQSTGEALSQTTRPDQRGRTTPIFLVPEE